MQEIKLIPYKGIQGKHYPVPVKIVLESKGLKNVRYQEGKITYSVSNCDFARLEIENLKEIAFSSISIRFTECYIEDLHVRNIETKNLSISFSNCILSGNIENENILSVSIDNCILSPSIFLVNLKQLSVSFREENIFPLRWRRLLKRLLINENEILQQKQSYYVYECTKSNFFSNYKDDNNGGIYKVPHGQNEYKVGLKLTPKQKELIHLNLSIKHESSKIDEETRIDNVVLHSLTMSGSPEGKLLVESARIANWYLSDFKPKSEATFYDISPPEHLKGASKIEFHKSNLDNAWFDNMKFGEYALVSFFRTKFSKTIFTSCNFPDNSISFEKFTSLENVHYPLKKKDNYYKDQYEVYLQLKMALEANGNFYEAQKLYAISNDALKRVQDVSHWDKVILRVNRFSNNHGLSITRPFLWFVTFSIGLYIFYLLSLGRIFNSNDFDWTLIGYYFSFIDPTHRSDFLVDKTEFTALSLFLDYLNKIAVAFFIYQFVAAFRKYGKS